jgi:Leucine-rich repeat (LRR) protein
MKKIGRFFTEHKCRKEAQKRINQWIKLNDKNAPLDLSHLEISVIPHIPVECIHLDVSNNRLKKLPYLPNLKILNCQYNKITILPPLLKCVELKCSGNNLTSLGELPECEILECEQNYTMTRLPQLPKCQILRCRLCKIEMLPPLPKCKELSCDHNNLVIDLPDLPECEILYCGRNTLLTRLPKLDKCVELECSYNKLVALPPLPNCKNLWCNNNNLTRLPELPMCEFLTCNDNKLVAIPYIPNCKYLSCYSNRLLHMTYIPAMVNWDRYEWFHVIRDNRRLYIPPKMQKYVNMWHHRQPINYNVHVMVIQRAYRNYLRKKYMMLLQPYVLKNPSTIVCAYT